MQVGEVRVIRRTDRFSAVRRFYEDVLGWPVVKEWTAEGDNPDGFIIAAGANARLEFLAATPSDPTPAIELSVEVDDVDEVVERLRTAGHEVASPVTRPWGHRSSVVIDPTGASLTIFQVVGDHAA